MGVITHISQTVEKKTDQLTGATKNVQAYEIDRYIHRELEKNILLRPSGYFVPNDIDVFVSTEQISSYRALSRQILETVYPNLGRIITENEWCKYGPLRIRFFEDMNLATGTIRIKVYFHKAGEERFATDNVNDPIEVKKPTFNADKNEQEENDLGIAGDRKGALVALTDQPETRTALIEKEKVDDGEDQIEQQDDDEGQSSQGFSTATRLKKTEAVPPTINAGRLIFCEDQKIDLFFGRRLILGRAADCDVVLADKAISARHANVVLTNEAAIVVNLGSANGILLNGVPVDIHAVLCDGDALELAPGERFTVSINVRQDITRSLTLHHLNTGRTHLLVQEEVIGGRARGKGYRCDVAFEDEDDAVSRYHWRLILKEDRDLVITDLGSSNGTCIKENNQYITTPYILADGQSVCFGNKTMAYEKI